MSSPPGPDAALVEVTSALIGRPVFVVGSCVAAAHHGLPDYGDVDVFTPNQQVLMTTIQHMLDRGWTLDERFDRVWYRWQHYGLKGWHTNSMKLHTMNGIPVNVVLKYVDGHPTTSLAQVLESFDFGLLGMGWDMEDHVFRDMRGYLFPELADLYQKNRIPESMKRWPMMPNKRINWVQGFISQYNGLREGYRYAKYHGYGYDMGLVRGDLVEGYRNAALYHSQRFEPEKKLLGEIYGMIAEKIIKDEIDELVVSYDQLDFNDPLDEIMEALQ